MIVGTAPASPALIDPFALALKSLTAPYARERDAALPLGPAASGVSKVGPYGFDTIQSQFGLQRQEIVATYTLTLLVDQLAGPAVLDIAYVSESGPGSVSLLIPTGTLAGTSFGIGPLPADPWLVLQSIAEHPVPAAGDPAGPQKWAATALLGNVARLLWSLAGERRTLSSTARDIKSQRHLLTVRGASLDRIGDGLGVPRLLPAPYRLDLDADTVALYHLDDAIAPVLDVSHDFPGVNVGAKRGVAGKFGEGCTVTASGGIVIPDGAAFAIDPTVGFAVEMFANLAAVPAAGETAVFAVKRPRFDQTDAPGWSLALEPSQPGEPAGHDLAFVLTDSAGRVVRAAAVNAETPAGWFHVAGVVDPATKKARVFLQGIEAASADLGGLGIVETCADIGLGADRTGSPHLNGSLDEVRFSSAARTDFSGVLGAGAKPYNIDGQTIVLYHLDETDDWIDEDRGVHFALNRGATRGVPARFGGGVRFLGDPIPHTRCPSERDFQKRLSNGQWDRTAGAVAVQAGPYARYGYRQGAISEVGLDGAMRPVLVNDGAPPSAASQGRVTTACYGFAPDDPAHPANPSDPTSTIAKFQAAGRTVQEAIDYFGEWFGLNDAFFTAQYQAHGIASAHEECLPADPVSTSVQIPGSAEFAFDAATSFTVEVFIKPDPLTDTYSRAIITTRSSALREGADNATAKEAGWALCLAPYRTIPNNLRWVLGDAAGKLVTVDANVNLADGAFHHVAGVVDRDLGAALLFVDGVEANRTALGGLAATATAGDVILGNAPDGNSPYAGLIDEVRISRGVRRLFQPVLGESDARYRQRLAIFQPWRLPSYPAIRRGVQALSLRDADPTEVTQFLLGDDPLPTARIQLDVDETDSSRSSATLWLRIIPQSLSPGHGLASDGTEQPTEPDVSAQQPLTATAPVLVNLPDRPAFTNLVFASPQSRLMVLATARALERLSARLGTIAPAAKLVVQSAFIPPTPAAGQPAVTTADSLGRAVMLGLDTTPPGVDLGFLGALAFEVGADYVRYASDAATPALRIVIQPREDLDLTSSGPTADGQALAVIGQPIKIAIARPGLPTLGVSLEWGLLRCGPGDGTLTTAGADPTIRTFAGTAAGRLTIEARATLADGITVLRGSLSLLVAPQSIDGCDMLGGDGRPGVAELDAAGVPDADFRTDDLVVSNDPGIDYSAPAPPAGTTPANPHLMQLALEKALIRLAALAHQEPGNPRITVQSAFDPAAATLQAVGRGMVVVPSGGTLTAARLGALAFIAGFAYVERRRYPPSVYVSVAQGDRFEILAGPLIRLWPNARVSGLGAFVQNEEDAAGPRDPSFNPGSLQPFSDLRVAFAAGVSNLMQPGLSKALLALLDALKADGVAGVLQIVAGFVAADPSLLGFGRALLFRHPSVPADRLAGYALSSGFGFVWHRATATGGPAVYAAAYSVAGPPPSVLAAPGGSYLDVYVGAMSEFRVRPRLTPKGKLDWNVQSMCPAAGELSTAVPDPSAPPGVVDEVFQGTAPGMAALVATFSFLDAAEPYQFLVQPAPTGGEGPPPAPTLTKDQYDDLLNFLDARHPLGVECVTRGLRAFVHGFQRPSRWDRLATAATFPRYRVPR